MNTLQCLLNELTPDSRMSPRGLESLGTLFFVPFLIAVVIFLKACPLKQSVFTDCVTGPISSLHFISEPLSWLCNRHLGLFQNKD